MKPGPWGSDSVRTQEHGDSRYFVRDDYEGLTIYMRADRFEADPFDPGEVTLYRRGKLWMICYSDLCPEGEGGHIDPRVPGIREVGHDEFHAARMMGWPT